MLGKGVLGALHKVTGALFCVTLCFWWGMKCNTFVMGSAVGDYFVLWQRGWRTVVQQEKVGGGNGGGRKLTKKHRQKQHQPTTGLHTNHLFMIYTFLIVCVTLNKRTTYISSSIYLTWNREQNVFDCKSPFVKWFGKCGEYWSLTHHFINLEFWFQFSVSFIVTNGNFHLRYLGFF